MSKKSKATKMKVMHVVEKDGHGQPTIRSIVSNPPKLKEAVDSQQVAEETGYKSKTVKPAKPKDTSKDELTDEQRAVLQALHDLGDKDKDVHSMDIAKKLGFDKSSPRLREHPLETRWKGFTSFITLQARRKARSSPYR